MKIIRHSSNNKNKKALKIKWKSIKNKPDLPRLDFENQIENSEKINH